VIGVKKARQPTYRTKFDSRKIPVGFVEGEDGSREMVVKWTSPEAADKSSSPGKRGSVCGTAGDGGGRLVWYEFQPFFGTLSLVEERLGSHYDSQGFVIFEAPRGTLFRMSGKAFREHKCIDYLERRALTGHWEIQGRSDGLNVTKGHAFYTGEPYRYVNGSDYGWDLRWYPEDPMSPESQAKAQAILDAMPERIEWNDYWDLHGGDKCEKGDWPNRPKGIHGYCPRDLEPCYHVEAFTFLDPTRDMDGVMGLDREFPNPDPTLWLPVRVKDGVHARMKKEREARYERRRAAREAKEKKKVSTK
jgi:hypothetical protein